MYNTNKPFADYVYSIKGSFGCGYSLRVCTISQLTTTNYLWLNSSLIIEKAQIRSLSDIVLFELSFTGFGGALKFLKCFICGSSIVDEEKIRHYQNGNIAKCNYYHCSRQVKRDCKETFAREQDIADELSNMCSEIITDLTRIEPGLHDAVDKLPK